ncbi:hypothetical protein Tco_0595357 [Tanacetum coccineum]
MSNLKYALTVNPTIYTSCIKQFWATAKAKTINGEVQIQALVDGKKVIVTETSVRRALQLKDAEAPEELGEGSEIPTDPQHTPTIIQPSTSQPQKKQPRRKQRKDTEVPQPNGSTEPITDEAANEEHVPTHFNDPLFSGEDRLKLNELMERCTGLSQRVIALETTKTNQALEIDSLKRRVKKLEKKKGSRNHRLKRLFKVGKSAQVVSSEDEEVTLINEAQERNDDNFMFDTRVLDEQEVRVKKAFSTAEVTTVSATTTTVDELTLAQTLIEIKAAKPKAVTTAATTTTTAITRPKARGVLAARLQAQEQEESTVKEKSKLFVEIMNKRKKHFARLRAEEQRRKPPSKAQRRKQMCTYLKNMAGFTHSQLKNKSFDEVQKAFNKTIGWIDSFVSMVYEVVKGGKEKDEGSVTIAEESNSKIADIELEQERIKKQKINDDQEEAEMKKHIEIVIYEEEIAVDAIPLATKPPIINIDREDLETLWKLVKAKHGNTRPKEANERVLWGDLKVIFEPDIEILLVYVNTDGKRKGTEDHTKEGSATQATQTPTSTIFGDDETIAKVLLNMSQAKVVSREKEKGIDLKDKGKKKIEEEDESESESDGIPEAEKKIEADRLLAKRLQEQEREQFTIEERAKFLHDTIVAQRKFLAQQRSEAIRNRPPTKNQLRNQMMTYLKHVGNFKHAELKIKKFEEIQALYEKIKRSDEDFISIGSAEDERLIKRMNEKGVDSSKSEVIKEENKEEAKEENKEEESTRKRKLGTRKKMKSRKRRYIQNTSEDDSEKENDELRLHLTIAPDEEKEVDYEILDRKYPIKEWRTECLGTKPYDDKAEHYRKINPKRLVMDRYQGEIPRGFDKVLWGDLMVMFNPNDEDEFWNSQQDWNIVSWKLHSSSGVHTLVTETGLVIHMLVEKKYPLDKKVMVQMMKLKLEV